MKHADLVSVASKWLSKRCPIVVTELATIGEQPDAIGWYKGDSILVECKTSSSDFIADGRKMFRENGSPFGVGRYRYFMCLPGTIRQECLPEGWGLLEVTAAKVREVRESLRFKDVNMRHEITILISALRRIGRTAPAGVSIRCYTHETQSRATLSVEDTERPTELAENSAKNI